MDKKLEDIGFYTLSDERALNTSLNSQMKRCEMIITEYCNFSCHYCRGLDPSIYGYRRIKSLSIEEIKNNIDIWCQDKPLENIRFSGGEPTLHPNIEEIISYSKNKGIKRIAISTNGSNKLSLYKNLIKLGANDFSISLDACCANSGDDISKVKGSWDIVTSNIREISKLTYVTVGIVLDESNIENTIDIIKFADTLGVSDIRIISAAQYNKPIHKLSEIPENLKNKYPILKYRINNFILGNNVRGLKQTDSRQCGLMIDDSVIGGEYHFQCVIHMREGGKPIGKVNRNMRLDRYEFVKTFNPHEDPICVKNCLDVCRDYNNKVKYIK